MPAPEPLVERAVNDTPTCVDVRAPRVEMVARPMNTSNTEQRDALLARLHSGATIDDSFSAITETLASEWPVDRVSLLGRRDHRCRLVATSTQRDVDRRTRQVRLLERLAESVLERDSPLTYELGSGSIASTLSPELEAYLAESGVRELHIEPITAPHADDTIALLVLERFRVLESNLTPIDELSGSLSQPIAQAVANALQRDQDVWTVLLSRWQRVTTSRKTWSLVAALALLMLVFTLVPMDLELPVDGTITATVKRHVFTPHDGIVSSVLVHGGESVSAGQALMTIRSPQLERIEQSVQASLATAQTRLDALLSLRGRDREPSLSVDEQTLRSEIAGLQQQAEMLRVEREALTVRSPIDGRVDAWELQQSFESRPITRGQHLLDVVTPEAGWTVELDIPDQQMGYVLAAQNVAPCVCRVRLRSDATTTYTGTLEQIDEVAHLNSKGESVVRATMKLESAQRPAIRNGATVVAQVNCGRHSLGFVCFRGVVQWWRGWSW